MSDNFCGACGGKVLTPFYNEAIPMHNGQKVIGLSGRRCADCGEVWLDDASHAKFAAAGNAAVLAARHAEGELLRSIRQRLKLTQHQAAKLTGGGHNAFGRYERGEVQPMPAVVNLFKILDAHPELLHEIQGATFS